MIVLDAAARWRGPMLPIDVEGAAREEGTQQSTSRSAANAASDEECLSPEALQQLCRSQGLAGFKLPRLILAQRHPLPSNSSGKVLKHVVRAQLKRAVKHNRTQSRL